MFCLMMSFSGSLSLFAYRGDKRDSLGFHIDRAAKVGEDAPETHEPAKERLDFLAPLVEYAIPAYRCIVMRI
jgi:hypothetical protein